MKIIFNRHYGGIICILLGLSAGGGASAALKDDFAAALVDYCIPKCESDCSKSFLAEYDAASGKCKCGANLTYDEDLRECVIKCPTGTYAHKGTPCPAGTYASSSSTCPAGAYKIGTTDEHGVMATGTSCPSGSYTITID
ncbi:MAG: hypothetical protein LBO78_03080 [Rickettsiales bacterium]|jgi:hypothetical protein|nr:hypothetical protein [Rickettsiales bacterium]